MFLNGIEPKMTREEAAKVALKLISLTQSNRLKWAEAPIPRRLENRSDLRIHSLFVTIYKNSKLQLYSAEIHRPRSSVLGMDLARQFGINPPSEFQDILTLEMVTEGGEALYTFPALSGLKDLLAAVKHQVSGIDDFVKDILAEET
jgi:hypothetical protein